MENPRDCAQYCLVGGPGELDWVRALALAFQGDGSLDHIHDAVTGLWGPFLGPLDQREEAFASGWVDSMALTEALE